MNYYNGYLNYTEWKRKDPDSYWAFIEGREKKLKFEIDEKFAERISRIKVPEEVDPFYGMVGRAVTNKNTLWDDMCEKIVTSSKPHFLLGVFNRFIDGNLTEKDSKKINRINKGLHPDILIVRFLKWLKKKICFWSKNDG
jgi:hypothetical protein